MPYNFSTLLCMHYARISLKVFSVVYRLNLVSFSTSYILTNKLLVYCLPNLTWRSELLVT